MARSGRRDSCEMSHGGAAAKKNDGEAVIPPPDGGWGWMVVFGSFMIHIIADGITYTLGIFIVEFMAYYDEGSESTSWIASILVGVTLGSGPVVSSLVNKYGCRPVTVVGAVIAAIGLAISIFAPNVVTLYVTIGIVSGFGLGLIYLPAIVSVTCYFEKKRSFATGIAVCGSGVGTFIFAPLTEVLVNQFAWKGAMLIISALTLNCVIFGMLFRPLEAPRKKALYDAAAASSADPEAACALVSSGAANASPNNNHAGNHLTASHPQLLQVPADGSPDAKRRFGGSQGYLTVQQDQQQQQQQPINGSRSRLSSRVSLNSSRKSSTHDLANASGVMYKKDVLYSGSMLNIPEYRLDPKNFSRSVLRIPEETEAAAEPDKLTVCGCIPCSRESYDTYKEMMDFSLLKDPVFMLFTLSNFCTSIGFNVPYVYMKDKSLEMGIPSDRASFLIAVLGIANTVGRVVLGYLSDKPWLNRLWVYNAALTIGGLATIFSVLCIDYTSMLVYASVYGAATGAFVGLTSVICVDLFGLDKLTNAFGLLLLFQGVASLVGPPIAGRLRDDLGSYDPGFYLAGSMIAASGLMLFFIPCLQRCTKRSAVSAKEMTVIHNGADK